MNSQTVTVDATQTVAIKLSDEVTGQLGLRSGSRLGVTIQDGRIVLQPLLADSLDELYGIFASSPGLVEELQQERRQETW